MLGEDEDGAGPSAAERFGEIGVDAVGRRAPVDDLMLSQAVSSTVSERRPKCLMSCVTAFSVAWFRLPSVVFGGSWWGLSAHDDLPSGTGCLKK